MAGSHGQQNGSMHCTELSEVLSCVSWLLTMARKSLVGPYKFTAGLINGEMTPQIHFPNTEMQQSQKQQKKTGSALF